jgi:integral membrane protein
VLFSGFFGGLVSGKIIKQLRVVGLLEGTSYLTLLGVAMPLKYIAGKPEMVEVVGWIHGLLFVGYSLMVGFAFVMKALNLRWSALAMVAAVLPFGPFVLDVKLRDLHAED